jgi:site-specific DNA-methyltransferase (adenine-specific)
MELRDLESYGEPETVVYLADCVELMRLMPDSCVDAVFADPPYRLSTGRGVTVKSGRLASVDKGSWDRSLGVEYEHRHHTYPPAARRPSPRWSRPGAR